MECEIDFTKKNNFGLLSLDQFDTETTGNQEEDKIIQVGVMEVHVIWDTTSQRTKR